MSDYDLEEQLLTGLKTLQENLKLNKAMYVNRGISVNDEMVTYAEKVLKLQYVNQSLEALEEE